MEREVKPIDPTKIVIARKWSAVEWEMYHRGISESELCHEYKRLGLNADNDFDSHFTQLASCKKIENILEVKVPVLIGETLTKKLLKNTDLVISLGGDNHLQYVSHFVDQQLMLGINSDYERSQGGMEYLVPEGFEWFFPKLMIGDYGVEEWARLKATVIRPSGETLKIPEQAISEIYVGTWARVSMSKYNCEDERHKDSGALIALPAGAGEGSWFNSAGGNIDDDHTLIPRTEKIAWYIATEVWSGRTLQTKQTRKTLNWGNQLEVNYSSYYQGSVSIDPKEKSGRNYKIKRGDRVIVEFGEKPLLYAMGRKD